MDPDVSKKVAVKLGMDLKIDNEVQIHSFISRYTQKKDIRIPRPRSTREHPHKNDLKSFFPTSLNMGPVRDAEYEKCPFDEEIEISIMSILGIRKGELRWGSVNITNDVFWRIIHWHRRADRDLLHSGYVINRQTCLRVAANLGLKVDGHDGIDAVLYIRKQKKFQVKFLDKTIKTVCYGRSKATGKELCTYMFSTRLGLGQRNTKFREESADKLLMKQFVELGGIEDTDVQWVTPYFA
ncbi:hypothetical protein ONZ45_g19664 [Pleurotus djamor]|nr:hypothetical protein ONZ45_g19664 [Pleurotus djamor]